ncbi:MAG: trypsin-like serine peptidase [Mycobacteriales bacterium]
MTAAAVGLVVVPASAETFLGDNKVNNQKVPDVANVVSQNLAQSLPQQKKALDYWTPERMKAASPLPVPVPDTKAGDGLLNVLPSQGENGSAPKLPISRNESGSSPAAPQGDPPQADAPKPAAPPVRTNAALTDQLGGIAPLGDDSPLNGTPLGGTAPKLPAGQGDSANKPQIQHSAPPVRTNAGLADPLGGGNPLGGDPLGGDSATPQETNVKAWQSGGGVIKSAGKVFFHMAGKDYLASATVVNSRNRDTLITAGHVVNEGPGKFATNFIFIPAYDNGSAPFGKWTARTLKAPADWTQKGDLNDDVGFAVMNKLNGKHIANVVGQQKIAFNAGKGARITAVGYPVYKPYDGQTLQFCVAQAKADSQNSDSTDHGILCPMPEGASGGMWAVDMQPNGIGTIVSVNSYSYSNNLDTMMGPALGSKVKSAYDAAQRA